MPDYKSPGVYVEEVDSGSAPIVGVGTGTAGFIGLVDDTVHMPEKPGEFELKADGSQKLDSEDKPIPIPFDVVDAGILQLITNWGEFKNKFGGIQEKNRVLAHGVNGFFMNGGTRCWVIRVTDLKSDPTADPIVDLVLDALEEFKKIDEIALLVVPMPTELGDANDTDHDDNLIRRRKIQADMVTHCVKLGDRFAVLDGEEIVDSYTPDEIFDGGDTDYGAVYFPWIDVTGSETYMPPSGHIAGLYARVDSERGVHKAPANEVIRGAMDLKYRLGKSHQDGLNPGGINCIRDLNGNIRVWGARTVGGDGNGEWKYINVRRLFLFLRESIDEGTQWIVFEPNTRELWSKISRNITAFLTVVWRSGALFGSSPEEAFYVKCDDETNPPEVRDLGQVVTEIGVAVVKPAEFVIFRIQQWAGPGS